MASRITTALFLSLLLIAGCATHIHTVGNGPQTNSIVEERQWYVLWGLVPINNVDSKAMAAGADDYQILTQETPIDVVINIFVGIASFQARTVRVTK